jgi:hypothetical protein
MEGNKEKAGVLYKIADCTRMAFIRVQSTIRADGPPSAQAGAPQFDLASFDRPRRQAVIARSARQPRFPNG